MKPDINNCIDFKDIAPLYNDTRRFIPKEKVSNVFSEISKVLINKFNDLDSIDVLDAGTGTGRLALKFAEAYNLEISQHDSSPKLVLHCVDISDAMLNVFKSQLVKNDGKKSDTTFTEFEYSDNVTIKIRQEDIRDLPKKEKRFHSVIAHWIFHTIFDWSITVFALEQIILKEGLFFLFEEDSELYNAIDGNFQDIPNNVVKGFWNKYHQLRRESLNSGIPQSARNRLGSAVKDEKVERLLSSLGWKSNILNGNPKDSWVTTYKLKHVIDNIIKKRAFTNMQLSKSSEKHDFTEENIEQKIHEELDSHGMNLYSSHWRFETNFKAKYYTRDTNQDNLSKSTLFLFIARYTLGRKWVRKIDNVYNGEALWRRLFDITWSSINHDPVSFSPKLLGITEKDVDTIVGIFASFSEEIMLDTKSIRDYQISNNIKVQLQDIWKKLANNIEIFEPTIISLSDKALDIPHGHYSFFNCLNIDESIISKLKTLDYTSDMFDDDLTGLLSTDSAILDLATNVKKIGLIPFDKFNNQIEFLTGLFHLAAAKNANYIYIFPYYSLTEKNIVGTMIICEQYLKDDSIDFISAILDLLYNEFLEEQMDNSE